MRIVKTSMQSLLLMLLLFGAVNVQAHKIIGGVYTDGALIEGEVGFSSGVMAQAGTLVEVFAPSGDKLGETRIEDGGLFGFTATRRVDHRFRANLGAGHVMDITLPADELPAEWAGGDVAAAGSPPAAAVVRHAPEANQAPSDKQLEQLVRKAVAEQVKPLRRELAEYKAQAKWHDVLGGIGYIFGLFGVGAWLRARQLDKAR